MPGCVPAPAGQGLLGAPMGGPPGGYAMPTAVSTRPARVFAARGRDLYDMTRRVIADLGGMNTVVEPGETVFIKPNFLTAGLNRDNYTATGEIAKVEVVAATAEECLRAGAARVTVGDGSQVMQFDWARLRTLDGSTHLAAEAARLNADYDNRLQLACLNVDSPDWDPVPAPRSGLGEISVSSLVTRADKIISIPVLKTHHIAGMTLSIKNFMGVMPIAQYGGGTEQIGRFRLHQAYGGPEAAFLDVVDALRPNLTIVDASICCEGAGPWVRPDAGRTVDMRSRLGDWLVLASTDLVAADAVAAKMIGQDYTLIPHLAVAYEQGFGQARPDFIALAGATLDELRVEWQPSPIIRPRFSGQPAPAPNY